MESNSDSTPIGVGLDDDVTIVVEAARMANRTGLDYLSCLAILEAQGW